MDGELSLLPTTLPYTQTKYEAVIPPTAEPQHIYSPQQEHPSPHPKLEYRCVKRWAGFVPHTSVDQESVR